MITNEAVWKDWERAMDHEGIRNRDYGWIRNREIMKCLGMIVHYEGIRIE